ncbi:anhydro-N-acetylmuramic acid kinase [Pokkaliibacter plantistimulans]|uniref:Anhydro-N-acetylmuramic acid kinase n=1 Tax=Pokkaliibacter plantistimulans TaxID=1635171 RepID=A0ABX5LY74_9GAMM|nr:anhydro-N-acetylmuramic acid kinase [Pokkaliibacter plantistimulans]PXF30133.1 anhydro-N-acetylmuramic acid kinase [Pokkaliibacter plantistimulans]
MGDNNTPLLFIGVMSGTSMDGVDAVLVDFATTPLRTIAFNHLPYPEELRADVLSLCQPDDDEINRLGQLDVQLARLYADCVNELISSAGVERHQIHAIGCHGQTIRHQPNPPHAFTLQIGDPNTLAELTGISVVSDFRRRDIAAGGQGAPLVPAFHHHLFHVDDKVRCVVNIGGIANITLLQQRDIVGFDTGPGNVLMDYWCNRHQQQRYDKDGDWAASAEPDEQLLATMLQTPYFAMAAPKSTGRELFNAGWLMEQLSDYGHLDTAIVQSTLCSLTAISISQAINAYANTHNGELYICGGGAFNSELLKRLAQSLPGWHVATTDEIGLAPQWVEATAFAWLAKQRVNGKTGNFPAVTGALAPRVLGAIYPP